MNDKENIGINDKDDNSVTSQVDDIILNNNSTPSIHNINDDNIAMKESILSYRNFKKKIMIKTEYNSISRAHLSGNTHIAVWKHYIDDLVKI